LNEHVTDQWRASANCGSDSGRYRGRPVACRHFNQFSNNRGWVRQAPKRCRSFR